MFQVLDSLKSGNEALKKIHSMMTIEQIEKILDETQDGIEKQREIDGLLSNNLSPEDLEEVETELEKLMAEENVVQEESPLSPADSEVVNLPEVPETPLSELEPGINLSINQYTWLELYILILISCNSRKRTTSKTNRESTTGSFVSTLGTRVWSH